MPRSATSKSLPQAFRLIEEMQAQGIEWRGGGLDEFLTCFRYNALDQRKAARTANAIERRFREVRRGTRPMGVFQDKTSMDRILFAVFAYENSNRGVPTLFSLTQTF